MQQREGWRREENEEGGVREEASVNKRLPPMTLSSFFPSLLFSYEHYFLCKLTMARFEFPDEYLGFNGCGYCTISSFEVV